MAGLFDKNGNATETHIATVSGFDAVTGEHLATYEVRIFAGTGIPGFTTLNLAPTAESGYAVCWHGSEWKQVIDLRGSTAYEKETGDVIEIKTLGPLSDELTAVAPATQYDKWDGKKWVKDDAAELVAHVAQAVSKKIELLEAATDAIAPLQDAVDLDMATDEEKAQLAAWKKYRVLLMRIDTAAPAWPTAPEV